MPEDFNKQKKEHGFTHPHTLQKPLASSFKKKIMTYISFTRERK